MAHQQPSRKVLVIAYYFPPMGLSGVQRTLKFVKFLPEFGWSPTVLTVTPRSYFAKDDTLLKEAEDRGVRIVRTTSLDPNRLVGRRDVVRMPREWIRKTLSRISDTLFIPDNKIGWKRSALKAASALLREEKFHILFATAPPQTDFLIGRALKERFGIPLVLDYRDAWVDYPFKFYPTPLHKWWNARLEKKVLKSSDAVVVASRSVKELLLRRYKYLRYNDVTIISQGFDPDDVAIEGLKQLPRTEKMRITYSGIFYEDRTPRYFLEALSRAFKRTPRMRGRIDACFIGAFRAEHQKIIARLGLQNDVTILGYLSHADCVAYQQASDVLWVMMQDDRSSPGKIFEYIGAQKKILGCMPHGFMRQIVEEAGGTCVDPTDVEAIARAIEMLYDLHERRDLRGPRPDVVDKYNRRTLTGELAKIFVHHVE